jgi:hypothetical protein
MRQDQLDKARQSRWRQDGNALVTLDDAERWLGETPLCLYLPRRLHLPVPAPSFVEAIAGRPDATPGPEHIAASSQMLARLVAYGAAIPLNLFGSSAGIVGEQPDFLATPEALPYLYALQPERNPKRPPTTVGGARVSPLAAEAYTLLDCEGALTTAELRSRLGREVTEAATLRALSELWHTMRVVPVPAENPQDPTHWELLSARHRRELNIGSTQSQTTALSVLVSFYLQSAIAATAEQVEIFLSPLASRSRIRDVVHGLSTTRQLASFSLAGDEHFYVEGTLPEVAEEIAEEEPAVALAAAIGADPASLDAGLEQNEPDLTEAAAANPPELTRQRPSTPRRSPRPAFGERARSSFAARDRRAPSGDRPPRREGGFRPPQRGTPHGSAPRADRSFERSSNRGFERRSERGFERGSEQRGGDRSSDRRPDRSFERRSEQNNLRRREGAEGATRPPRPDFERRPRPGGSDRPKRFGGPDRFDRSGSSRGSVSKDRFRKPGGFSNPKRRFDEERPPRSADAGFRRDKRSDDRNPNERPRFRPKAGGASSRFERNRPGHPPARGGDRPPRDFRGSAGDAEGRSGFRPNRTYDSDRPFRPDRPVRKPQEDRRPAGSRGFEGRPPRRDGQSRPQGGRSFKRPYSPAGDRPQRRPEGRPDASGNFPPRPRPEGGDRDTRPFRPSGSRPDRRGAFSKAAGRSGSFGKPYRKRPDDRSGAPETGADRPRSPRPAFDSGTRPGARKPFGKSRPSGAGAGRPRPDRAGKPGGRPPAKGGFKSSGFKAGGKRLGGKPFGGFAPPRRKPRGESEQGNES